MSLRRRIVAGLGWSFQPDWKETCAAGAPVPDEACAGRDCDSVSLSELQPGEWGTVSCLQQPAEQAAWKLAAMGVLPGAELHVVQRYPACIFRIGHSEFAIDQQMAGHVRVHRLA
jgi:DtxR family Mn-dependent transcriptional regulator